MSLEARLLRVWYANERVPAWLGALEPVYRGVRTLARVPYAIGWRRPVRVARPVIVVGNLTAGGSGKTPLVIALVTRLREAGLKAGIVSRGHGGRERGPMLLDDLPDPARVGDEPSLLRRRTGCEVAIGRDRAAAAALLLGRGVDVIVADDGLQHHRLARDVEVCVVDGQRRFGNRRLLPAGPLREPLSRLRTVDFVVCNGGAAQAGEVPMRLVGEVAVPVRLAPVSRPLEAFAGQRVHAVAGIGHPERFFDGLRAHGIDVIAHAFADHHPFAREDIAFDDDLPVLMTEKDAVKCVAYAGPRHWCVPVRAELPQDFLDAVLARVQRR
jgi:tetraacyldisaccharide 4'-kinase